MLVLLAEDAKATNRSAGVLVFNPYSFALAYDASSSTPVLFDSHAHGEAGAFLACAPHAVALEFLKSFFGRFYRFAVQDERSGTVYFAFKQAVKHSLLSFPCYVCALLYV